MLDWQVAIFFSPMGTDFLWYGRPSASYKGPACCLWEHWVAGIMIYSFILGAVSVEDFCCLICGVESLARWVWQESWAKTRISLIVPYTYRRISLTIK
jgi:hypothetical protein